MEKVIILSRVSTYIQDLNQQTEEIVRHVKKDGYSDEQIIFIEDKESGIQLDENERKGLNKLKEYINNDPEISIVYIYEISRISRKQKVLFSIRDFLVEHKVQLICIKPYFKLLDDNGDMSQITSLLFSLFSSVSESEMMLKKERMKRGREYNKSHGKIYNGFPMFGYKIDKNKRYIPHPEETKILQRIFKEYTETDKTLKTISRELKDEGLFPNTQIETLYCNLQRWTKNINYVGNSTYPQLISKRTFDLCKESRLRHKSVHKTKTREIFLLKGLLYDLDVQKMMCSSVIRSRLYQYTSQRRDQILGHSVSQRRIDPVVWEESKNMYKKYIINKKKHIKLINDNIESLGKKLTGIDILLEKNKKTNDKLEERIILGKISQSKQCEIEERLLEEKMDLENRKLKYFNEYSYKLLQKQEVELSPNEIDLDSLSFSEKVEVINKVIDIISFKRIDRNSSIINIYNKFDNNIIIYKIFTFGKQLGEKIGERKMSHGEKRPSKHNFSKRVRHDYLGNVC